MSDSPATPSRRLRKEAALFLGLLFFGFVIVPVGIWFVGNAVFGAYEGYGYADFFGNLSARIRAGDVVAWFLVLSPWLVWQVLRLAAAAWRATGKL
ncbi:MAG: hypothetical protein MJA32_06470 [Proteobacteria bacterium]|nr:hypothetical protein [Pseudomonadota bacterium]